MQRIREDISPEAVRLVMYLFLSELTNLDMPFYFYLREGLIRGPDIDRWHVNPHV